MKAFKSAINHSLGRWKDQRGSDGEPPSSTHESSPNTQTQESVLYQDPAIPSSSRLGQGRPFSSHYATPCSMCQTITVEKLLQGCQHHRSFSALKASATSGCNLCRLFYDGLVYSYQCTFGVADIQAIKRFEHDKVKLIQVDPGLNEPGTTDRVLVQLWPSLVVSCEIGVYVTKDSLYAKQIFGNALPDCPDVTELCETVRGWLADTGISQVSELPRRVIDVRAGSLDSVCLRELSSILGEDTAAYICLSHRWNQETSALSTTKNSLQERKLRIWIRDLSQTFRDAIAITRELGIRYLWIDSLCIVQDSPEDWERESSMMGNYYRSAYLTIGAGMLHDGLFIPRHTDPREYCRLEIPPDSNPGHLDSSVYFLMEPLGLNQTTWAAGTSPLESRCWTMQERLLSQLFLSFEPSQVFLHSTSTIFSECGKIHPIRFEDKWKSLLDSELEGWKTIVRDYSCRELTQSSDKLPAISGFAQDYQQRWNVKYLAGLWEKDLWKQLLWSRRRHTSRPREGAAPSWSWASVDGSVEFKSSKICCIEVLDCEIEIAGKNPFGQVKRGILTLKGVLKPLKRVRLYAPNLVASMASGTHIVYFGEEKCDISPDRPLDPDLEKLWFLYISPSMGIALRLSNEGNDYFERVGFLRVSGHILDSDQHREVKII